MRFKPNFNAVLWRQIQPCDFFFLILYNMVMLAGFSVVNSLSQPLQNHIIPASHIIAGKPYTSRPNSTVSNYSGLNTTIGLNYSGPNSSRWKSSKPKFDACSECTDNMRNEFLWSNIWRLSLINFAGGGDYPHIQIYSQNILIDNFDCQEKVKRRSVCSNSVVLSFFSSSSYWAKESEIGSLLRFICLSYNLAFLVS